MTDSLTGRSTALAHAQAERQRGVVGSSHPPS